MGLYFKKGVNCRGISSELQLALQVANEVYFKHGYDCIVTSMNDGRHSRGSRHYIGHAVDLRTHHLDPDDRPKIATAIAERLRPIEDFDVMHESIGTSNEHIHIQFKPKGVRA